MASCQPGKRPWPEALELRERREFLFHRAALEDDVARQTAFDRHLDFALDERPGVSNELLVRKKAVVGEPIPRDDVFLAGDLVESLEVGGPFVRLALHANELHHVTALVVHG